MGVCHLIFRYLSPVVKIVQHSFQNCVNSTDKGNRTRRDKLSWCFPVFSTATTQPTHLEKVMNRGGGLYLARAGPQPNSSCKIQLLLNLTCPYMTSKRGRKKHLLSLFFFFIRNKKKFFKWSPSKTRKTAINLISNFILYKFCIVKIMTVYIKIMTCR